MMAYIKLEDQGEKPKESDAFSDDVDLAIDDGVPLDNEAASDEARTLMRIINDIGGHCSAIKTILATIPPSPARAVAQQKVIEVQLWAGQAFIESEL
jgi:hypothetical protein